MSAERVTISKRLVLINSIASLGQRILSLTILFWLQRYLIQRVPLEEYKVLAVLMPLLLYVPILTMAVTAGLSRYVIEAYAHGDERRVTQIVSTMFPLCALSGLAVAICGSLVTWKIEAVANVDPAYVADARLMFVLLFLPVAVKTAMVPFLVGFDVKQKYVFANLLGVALDLLRIGLLFALLFGVSTRVIWVVVAGVPGAVLDLAVSFVYSRRFVPALRFRWSEMRRELVRPIVSFGGWTFVGRTAAVLREMSGPLLLSHLSSAAAVASYRLGSFVETKFFPSILRPLMTVQPALTAMHAGRQEERLRRSYFRMSRYLLWGFLFFAVPGMVYHREFWFLWLGEEKGAQLAAGSLVMVLLFAKSFFVFPQPVLAQVALAKARNGPMAMRAAAIEISAVALTWYLLARHGGGAVAVALATFAASAVGTPLLHWTFGFTLTRASARDWMRETLALGLVPAAAAAPLWLALHHLAPPASWLQLVLHIGTGCAVYAAVLMLFCLRPAERQDLRKLLGRRRGAAEGQVT